MKGGTTEIAFVEVRLCSAAGNQQHSPGCSPHADTCSHCSVTLVLVTYASGFRVMQDPTGYKYELIQRPEHKGDRILHVRNALLLLWTAGIQSCTSHRVICIDAP